MRVKVTRQNITQDELIKALSGYIQTERIEDGIIQALQKTKHVHDKEIIPEQYIRTINTKMDATLALLLATLYKNLDLWFKNASKPSFFSRKPKIPVLNQKQTNELRDIIVAHFLFALGMEVSKDITRVWAKLKLIKPSSNRGKWVTQAFIAGLLANELNHKSTYAEMMRFADGFELTRQNELLLQAAQDNATRFMVGYGRKLADIAENTVLKQQQAARSYLTQQYFDGKLKQPSYSGGGFSRAETKVLLSVVGIATSIMTFMGLANELREQMNAEDMASKMKTMTESEIRYATNLGRIMSLQREGGGNAKQIGVYYEVQPGACQHCKAVYLNEDGSPKIFLLSEIINNLESTGGMNFGLKASLIGKEGGWVPNVLLHPNCRCLIMPYYEEEETPKGG